MTRTPGATDWLALGGWIVLSLAAGGLGAVASANASEYYATLVQPSWAPPSSVFGPVWTTLYILMGIAAWLVWRSPSDHPDRRRGIVLFVVQLVFNALWTWLFFAWHRGALAFAEILLLWVLIALTIHAFARVRALAAWLLVPYLAWVTFAAALTWAMWQGNPGRL